MTAHAFPVHDPRASWRNTLGRRFVLFVGWAGMLVAAASLVLADQIGALWAWGMAPAAAGFAGVVRLMLPEPRPVVPARPTPKYLLADQRLNLLAAVPQPEPVAQVIDAYRSHRRLAVPQRQAA